jgi:homoaconitase/3-isopropylmalate dehydratase large subunit
MTAEAHETNRDEGNTTQGESGRAQGDTTSNQAVSSPTSHAPPNTQQEQVYDFIVEPNSMSYEDDQGIVHHIYMPKGTMKKATEFFLAKNWVELAKFPPWGM